MINDDWTVGFALEQRDRKIAVLSERIQEYERLLRKVHAFLERGEIPGLSLDDGSYAVLEASSGGSHELGMDGLLVIEFHAADGNCKRRRYIAEDKIEKHRRDIQYQFSYDSSRH